MEEMLQIKNPMMPEIMAYTVSDIPEKMERVNQYMERFLETDDPLMKKIMKWILENRGKQIRPLLVLLSASFGIWRESIIEMAASLEILHMASLVHDDIIDDADKRRGRDSVQRRFGKNAAIYAGDFMVFSVLTRLSTLPRKKQYDVYRSLSNLCLGELMQYENLYNIEITEETYLKQIEGKTAMLFQIACIVGATESRCGIRITKRLAEFGLNFGMAFQIQDDLLDVTGSKGIGKPSWNDIREGVYTLPLIHAIKTSENGEKIRKLLETYRIKQSDEILQEIHSLIRQSGALQYALQRLHEYQEKAIKSLEKLTDSVEKSAMIDILNQICMRAEESV